MIINYLEGLQWNLNYYLKGIQNWLWSYQYHAAPFFGDIFHFISKRGMGKLIQASREIRSSTWVPTAIEQLLIVLPPESWALIPEPWRKLTEHPSLCDYYPSNEPDLDFLYKIRDWEHKPILPDMDFSKFHKIVCSQNTLVYKYD